MPREMGFDYSGMSFQEQQASKGVPPAAIFGLSLLFVFLILAAQYESWSLPFSVLLGTPVAVFGAYLALWARHFENNVYAQIGLVMLIGLAAKNAILIVEFAKAEYERGKSIEEAALTGARIRLRPILMTAFRVHSGLRSALDRDGLRRGFAPHSGTAVIGGMLAASADRDFFDSGDVRCGGEHLARVDGAAKRGTPRRSGAGAGVMRDVMPSARRC